MTSNGPDFICVGMPKAGTDWLYDQLHFHPEFWMPPVKEIDYLAFDCPRLKHVNNQRRRAQKGAERRLSNRRSRDHRDISFLEEAAKLTDKPRDIAAYGRLFRHKGDLLTGDVSPGYCRMEADVISSIADTLPMTKILLLVRDPIGRAWSHVSLLHRKGKFDTRLLERPELFRAFLEDPDKIQKRSFPSRTATRWIAAAPQLSFRHFFFDDIAKHPDKIRAEILAYLGADPAKPSGDLPAGFNRKASAPKLSLTEPIRTQLVDFFQDELRACRELFGGVAHEWARQYGL